MRAMLSNKSHPAWVCGLKPRSGNINISFCTSHPAWVCGLKLSEHTLYSGMTQVTPCVGVWIETFRIASNRSLSSSHPAWVCGLKPVIRLSAFTHPKSHPAWVCGLKQAIAKSRYFALESHPAWVCGLKLQEAKNNNFRLVTPCVGVWIETSDSDLLTLTTDSHTLRGCVD